MKGAPSPPFKKRAQIPSQSFEEKEVSADTDIRLFEENESKIAQLKKEREFYHRIILSQEKTIRSLSESIEKSENSQDNSNISSIAVLKKLQDKHKYLIGGASKSLVKEKLNSTLDPTEINSFLKMRTDRKKVLDKVLDPQVYKMNIEKQISDKNQKLKLLQTHLTCMAGAGAFIDKEYKRNQLLKEQISSLQTIELSIPLLEKGNAELRKQLAELERGVKLQESTQNLSLLYENELSYYLILKQIEEFARDNLKLDPH